MAKSKVKNNKKKTHKASAKRFHVTANGNVEHLPQGGGSGHSKGYMNRRQKTNRNGDNTLGSKKEAKKITKLANK